MHRPILTRGYWTLKSNTSVSQTHAHPCSFADADARANPGLGPSIRKRTLKSRFVIVQLVAIVMALFPGLPMAHFLFACVTHQAQKLDGGKAWEEGKICNFRG